MFDPGPCVYMEKMAGGADIADLLSLEDPMEDVLRGSPTARRTVGDLMIVILDRPRHNEMVERIRRAGARIRFISDGDVAGALLAAREGTGVDLLWGIGGTPEGVLSATAIKCLGGAIMGRCGHATRARRAAPARPATTSTGSCTSRISLPARTASSRPRASRTEACSTASATTAEAPRPTRWSCVRARERCGSCTPATIARSSAPSPASATADRRLAEPPAVGRVRLGIAPDARPALRGLVARALRLLAPGGGVRRRSRVSSTMSGFGSRSSGREAAYSR